MNSLLDKLGEVQAETLSDTLVNVMAQLLVAAVPSKPRRGESPRH